MTIQTQDRLQALAEFYNAPETALFSQVVVAAVRDCSTCTLERDHYSQGAGIPLTHNSTCHCLTNTLLFARSYDDVIATYRTGRDLYFHQDYR